MFTEKSWKNFKVFAGAFCVVALTPFFGINSSVHAADTVVIRYGPIEESVSLEELKKSTETGKLPDSLGTYTKRMTEEQRRFLVEGLKIRIPINVATLGRLINTQIGTTILSDVSTAITRRDQSGLQAMKGGLVLAANSPQGLSILSFIAAYPSKRLEINLPQALTVAGSLNGAFVRTQRFMFGLSPQVNPKDIKVASSLDPTQAGSAQVQTLKLSFNDQKRQRQIPLDVYFSTAASVNKPVIVLSHGWGSVRTDLRYLAEHLASHGYVVGALEHPGSNETTFKAVSKGRKQLVEPQEFLDRPKDVSFIVDELEKVNQTANSPLRGKLATNNVMVVGYSFGGGTALALAGGELQIETLKQRCQQNLANANLGETLQCVAQALPEKTYQLRDARIKQAIALNPTTSLMFGETGLTKVQIPTLILSSSADKITPPLTEQVMGFAKIPAPKWLVGVVGASHLSIIDPSLTPYQMGKSNTPILNKEVVGEQSKDVRKFLKGITLAMAAQLTPEASQYAPFLTADYAQISSTRLFPFRTVRELSPEMIQEAQSPGMTANK
ncbi:MULTISPECIES: alpha/beta hydrolase [Dolichospermum]|uniref:Alpha/beta hydrolase n=1 Tax=Dolichospermum heterosporum TAC447 TaxID=747523 RepID=A0ABY5LWF8_9CYAN|nr:MULTISPECIES: alpha/beta hydrolase [Dolichospermum]MBE9256484.1 alpha/beta hydrolase [Dolichospermum sp. LEGE 00246]MDK2410876.1 alpha/beta hydrolase [Aphanizomenon sp. 202]MDK2461566.1 alpha/beta hydrolase [Aphanizomenon sp. PH219]UUO15159.1 alpha/beta hydrolase [Dolichospermum heterosporum TAC447]